MEKTDKLLHKGRHIIALLILIFISGLVIFFTYRMYANPVAAAHPKLSLMVKLMVPAACAGSIAAYILFIVLKTDKQKTLIVFALILAAIISVVIPPNAVSDEFTHFDTAYNYSNIILGLGGRNSNKQIYMRNCDLANIPFTVNSEKYVNSFGNFRIFASEEEQKLTAIRVVIVNTSPVYVYIPQIIGITAGRLLRLSGTLTYYIARFLNLGLYLILLYLAVKKMPFGKTALAIIGIFPISLQQAASMSSDAFINALAFLLTASVLSMIYSGREISAGEIIAFLVMSVMLAPCKLVYFAIPFMALLIPKQSIKSKPLRLLTKIAVPILSVAALIILEFRHLSVNLDNQTSGTAYSDTPTYSVYYIFTNTKDFIILMLRTLKENVYYYMVSMVSSPLGSLQIGISGAVFVIYVILTVMGLLPTAGKSERIHVGETQKLMSAAIFAGSSVLVIISMLSAWTPNNSPVVLGVQGRYFLPLLPLIIPIAYTDKLSGKEIIERYALFGAVSLGFYTAISALGTAVIQ